jgi:hypothetical protein
LALRFRGLDYVTYNHHDSAPESLGARITRFAREFLGSAEATHAFGRKVAALEWVQCPRRARSAPLQGADLLVAIARGEVTRIVKDDGLFRTCLDCEFAYILDLDGGTLECWDLRERMHSFPLAELGPPAEREGLGKGLSA